ncbi:MAG: lipid-A-disaccharide synthase [Gemmatimonadetes bacterium]|nr:lipid-A-disaccharide synthase [Gemmatimonadota bacterium]
MKSAAPTILLSAGEPSGDLHGSLLAAALKRLWPEARLFGLGGARMAAAGVELLADLDRLALMGFVEVVARLPFYVRLLRRVQHELQTRPADLVLPIDYPGFNLRLARRAHRAGVPVLYYIAPQVWAWHASRARDLARYVSRLALVLPFEQRLFAAAGARASFVGHPLLDLPPVGTTREDWCASLGLDPARPVLALFPGSRRQEVVRHLPLFVEAAELAVRRHPGLQPVIAVSAAVAADVYDGAHARTAEPRELLSHARAALVKSGTTTLEAALAGTPLVIAYRAQPLTYWLAKRLVRVPHIGLVNLVAGERLAPEFLQDEATPPALAAALDAFLGPDGPARRAVTDGLARVRSALAPPADGFASVADRVAHLAVELLHARA